MLRRFEDVTEVRSASDGVVMWPMVRAEDQAGLSVTVVEIQGTHRPLSTARSVRIYYIESGEGTFQVGDDPPCQVTRGDVVVIERGVRYSFTGQGMRYLVLNVPAFCEGDDVY